MKIVLSRKGMDSDFGGIPSPIIQSQNGNWKFYSVPIPTQNSDTKYSDLSLFDDFKVSSFLADIPQKSRRSKFCHLDPDIRKSNISRRPIGWQPNFGQVKSAQSHLNNFGIGKGDVFLFFGWFRRATFVDGTFQYIKDLDYPNGFHAIYSYLQIDEIYKPNIQKVPDWLNYHPHVKYKDSYEFNNANNTIYTAKELFEYPEHFNKNGSASFVFSEDLILTKKGQPNRSLWELPLQLHPNSGLKLSYHLNENRWNVDNTIGQY